MAIKTGKVSLKALMENKEKVEKDTLVGVRTQVVGIVKGTSSENGDFVYLLFNDDKFASVPSANVEEFAEYAGNAEDVAEFNAGKYDVIYEKATSKKGREYFTCYLEEHK